MKSNPLAEGKNRLNSRTPVGDPVRGVADCQGQRAAHPDIVNSSLSWLEVSAVPITLY